MGFAGVYGRGPGDTDETERIFCTTDVHKAFDQVYRGGAIYLLCGTGAKGKMLHMLGQWISKNYAVQKWRGHTGVTERE